MNALPFILALAGYTTLVIGLSRLFDARRARRQAQPPTAKDMPKRLIRVTGAEIAAARLRLSTDKAMGKTSPAWVRRLAETRRHGR